MGQHDPESPHKVNSIKADGARCFTKGQLKYVHKKYDELINEGKQLYPPPEKIVGKGGPTKKVNHIIFWIDLLTSNLEYSLLYETFQYPLETTLQSNLFE